MKILFKVVAVSAIAAGAGLLLASGSCGSTSGEPPAEILVENQRLRSENESLALENERLSTTNQDLQERLNELRIEGAGQASLALENVRLSGELERARIDAAEEAARRDELEDTLAEERRSRIRLEGLLDREQPRDSADGFGWLEFMGLLVLAGMGLLWRELRWRARTRVLTTEPRVVQEGTDALTGRVADVTPVKVNAPDR